MKTLLFLLLFFTVANCQLSQRELIEAKKNAKQKAALEPFLLGRSINRFATDLYTELSNSANSRRNIIFSPFSIHLALAMIYYGSPKSSSTHQELARVLGFSTVNDKSYNLNFYKLLDDYKSAENAQISVANRIFIDDTFRPKTAYNQFLDTFFGTETKRLDFDESRDAVDAINDFVSDATRGLIRDLLESGDVDGSTRMVLINAIYFKAAWLYEFNRQDTTSKRFYPLPGQYYNHRNTMVQRGNFYSGENRELDAKILELPYSNTDFRMFVILPNDDDLDDLESRIRDFDLSRLDRNLDQGPTVVQLPAFEATYRTSLEQRITDMGARSMFDPKRANLSDISSSEQLYVQDAIHMARIIVNEEGSEAAAATAAVVGIRAGTPTVERQFIVNKPFMFVIQDANKVPLFMGRIVSPAGEDGLRNLRTSRG